MSSIEILPPLALKKFGDAFFIYDRKIFQIENSNNRALTADLFQIASELHAKLVENGTAKLSPNKIPFFFDEIGTDSNPSETGNPYQPPKLQ